MTISGMYYRVEHGVHRQGHCREKVASPINKIQLCWATRTTHERERANTSINCKSQICFPLHLIDHYPDPHHAKFSH